MGINECKRPHQVKNVSPRAIILPYSALFETSGTIHINNYAQRTMFTTFWSNVRTDMFEGAHMAPHSSSIGAKTIVPRIFSVIFCLRPSHTSVPPEIWTRPPPTSASDINQKFRACHRGPQTLILFFSSKITSQCYLYIDLCSFVRKRTQNGTSHASESASVGVSDPSGGTKETVLTRDIQS